MYVQIGIAGLHRHHMCGLHAGLEAASKAAQDQLASFVAWLEEYELEDSREERTFSVWITSLLNSPLRSAAPAWQCIDLAVQLSCLAPSQPHRSTALQCACLPHVQFLLSLLAPIPCTLLVPM